MGVEIIKVKPADDGIRLNRWFLKYYPGLSLGKFNKLLRTKQIKVDGARAEASLKLMVGQEIRVPPLEAEKVQAQHVEISAKDKEFIRSLIVYKDDNIIVINKPSGVAVQGGSNIKRHIDGMLEGLMFERDEKPKLVHRIDKETSGILVLARDRKNAEVLTSAFKDKKLSKTYLLISRGVPKINAGEVKVSLEKNGEKMTAVNEGKKAITKYKVIDTSGNKFALIEASPLTGRTHQIRAHMEHIGCPIVGDDKYFGSERVRYSEFADKLFLHAYKIDLSGIYNKKPVISVPLPEHFKNALNLLGISFKG